MRDVATPGSVEQAGQMAGGGGELGHPDRPATFVRLVPGPDVEAAVDGGTWRVISVEVFDTMCCVVGFVEADQSYEYRPSQQLVVSDGVGTDYRGFGGGTSARSVAGRFLDEYQEELFSPAPPPRRPCSP